MIMSEYMLPCFGNTAKIAYRSENFVSTIELKSTIFEIIRFPILFAV